jgi:hypothetical protein
MKPELIAIAAALLAGAAGAAEYKAPRTVYGQPDLQGVWNTHFVLPIEARPDTPSLTLPEAEAKAYARKLNAEAGKLEIFAQDPEATRAASRRPWCAASTARVRWCCRRTARCR